MQRVRLVQGGRERLVEKNESLLPPHFIDPGVVSSWPVPSQVLSRTAASASPVAVRVRVLAKLVVGDGEAARIADRLDVPGDPGGALARGVPTQCANNVWTGRRGGSFSRFSPSSSGTGATSHASRTPSQATSRTRPAYRYRSRIRAGRAGVAGAVNGPTGQVQCNLDLTSGCASAARSSSAAGQRKPAAGPTSTGRTWAPAWSGSPWTTEYPVAYPVRLDGWLTRN